MLLLPLLLLNFPLTVQSNGTISDSESRFPSAIIIGVKKCGTRALLEFLRLNDAIRAPGPEVHFFDRHYERGLNWYRRQMPLTTDRQITIEKSPSYFVTKKAPSRIKDFNPSIKLIVVVRDPVIRAISDYTQTASKRPSLPDFEQMAFVRNDNDYSHMVNKSWGAIRIGIYHRFAKRWLRYFPAYQMHFVDGEKLIRHPDEEISRVEKFLGLESRIGPENFDMSDKGFPCIRKVDHFETTLHCLGKTKGRIHPYVSPKTIDRLRSFYKSQNRRFYRLVNRNFGW